MNQIQTFFTQHGIGVAYHTPIRVGAAYLGDPAAAGGDYLGDLTHKLENYEHTIQFDGGFWSASMQFQATQTDVDDWLESGLGRHIVARSRAGQTIWEGFVNRVEIGFGGLSITFGPLLEIVNRVQAIYTPYDPAGVLSGLRLATAWAEDSTSINSYGIYSETISAGEVTEEQAELHRDRRLQSLSRPAKAKDWINSGGSTLNVRIDCLGYVHRLGVYSYANADTGLVNVSDKIASILAYEPNSMFILTPDPQLIDATDFAGVDANTLQVAIYTDETTAWEAIKPLVEVGDTNGNRWAFGIYEDREPVYRQAETELAYLQRLRDPKQRITLTNGVEVNPWDVRPGKWIQFSDLLVGLSTVEDIAADPRATFIESVSYRAPWSIQLSGQKDRRLDQRLGRFGLVGTGGTTGVE